MAYRAQCPTRWPQGYPRTSVHLRNSEVGRAGAIADHHVLAYYVRLYLRASPLVKGYFPESQSRSSQSRSQL